MLKRIHIINNAEPVARATAELQEQTDLELNTPKIERCLAEIIEKENKRGRKVKETVESPETKDDQVENS